MPLVVEPPRLLPRSAERTTPRTEMTLFANYAWGAHAPTRPPPLSRNSAASHTLVSRSGGALWSEFVMPDLEPLPGVSH